MKSIVFALVVCTSFAVRGESVLSDYYIVVSDVFDASLKPATCKVSGIVKDDNEGIVPDGIISNFDRSHACFTNADGKYSMSLSPKDTAIFFYHENYGEIILWHYDFKSQHHVVINFVTSAKTDYPVMEEKPVIYLYSDQPTSVNLTLKHDALTFTYPAYNKGWSVITNSNGGITNDEDGKKYPYLFWEGKTENLAFKKNNGIIPGSIIETKASIEFLEKSLTALGLNSTEATDFITYWGPRLQQKEYAFVQFLIDEEVDETIAELTVTPLPTSKRRVYLIFALLDKPEVPFAFEAQQFSGFDRNGLTLLEWGGSEISLRSIVVP